MERANASVARMAAESDLNDKVGSLSEDRNALESGLVVLGQHMGGRINALEWEVAKIQSQLQLEKNLRLESGEHAKVIIIYTVIIGYYDL